MAKSRDFSIFLLKENYNATNALRAGHKLGKPIEDAINLPNGAILYVLDKEPTTPWWKDYWGIEQNLEQVLKGAIVFLEVSSRCFAITFGHTYHNLNETSYEYDFGLRVTLNTLDPEKIKSTDIFMPENAKRERIQSPIASDLTFFDLKTDESIVKKLTGMVRKEYQEVLTNVTGSSSLKISSKVLPENVKELCEQLLEIYHKEEYREHFPNIQNIIPVKDPTVIEKLNEKLVQAFHAEEMDLVLTIPEIIEYDGSFQFSFSGAGRDRSTYDDVFILYYRRYLRRKSILQVTIQNFNDHKLNILDEAGCLKKSYSIYKSLVFDCELNDFHYHLCEGEWYQVDKNYISKLKAELDPVFVESSILLECGYKLESDYNEYIAKSHNDVVCLDAKNMSIKGQTQIEPCDLLYVNEGVAQLFHIKISTRSSLLSHLFNQGMNSVELLRVSEEARENLKKMLSDVACHSVIDEGRYSVVYGIITGKNPAKKSDNLPIFSRISLLRAINHLRVMGVSGSIVFIKDSCDRKNIQEDD